MTDPRIEAAARMIGSVVNFECGGDWERLTHYQKTHFRRLAKAVLEEADAAAWRSIETAPANKEIVLGWASYSFTGFKDELFSESAEIGKFFSSKSGLKNGPLKRQPTHWQHLPAPPASIDALGGVDG